MTLRNVISGGVSWLPYYPFFSVLEMYFDEIRNSFQRTYFLEALYGGFMTKLGADTWKYFLKLYEHNN